jgi:malate synthase
MTDRTTCHRLHVATSLYRFIEDEVLPGTGIDTGVFWKGFDAIVHELAPKNAALLAERDRLQAEMDAWHEKNPGPIRDMTAYKAFLRRSATCRRRRRRSRRRRRTSMPNSLRRPARSWSCRS